MASIHVVVFSQERIYTFLDREAEGERRGSRNGRGEKIDGYFRYITDPRNG